MMTSPTDTDKRGSLREKLDAGKTILAPGAYDCVTARIVAAQGFDAVYVSGMALEATRRGFPDLGLMGMTEMVEAAGSIARSVPIPTVSDADTGYGGVLNVVRTIAEFDRAGVAAVHLEDQTLPKKCGGLPGRGVIRVEEMVGRIEAAREALNDDAFVIIARSDAKHLGIDTTAKRLNEFLRAGADVAMVGERYERDELARLADAVDGPLCVVSGVLPWRETLVPVSDYEEIGVRMLIYALTGLSVAAHAVSSIYGRLRDKRGLSVEDMRGAAWEFDEINQLVGLDMWSAIDARYGVPEA